MVEEIDKRIVQECEMHIVGHKIFVRMKDIPMYLSKKTKDSIRNRYSHSIEVGLGTEYVLSAVSRQLGNKIDLNFLGIAKIIGMVHDIGHTAFSHDGEVILNSILQKSTTQYATPIYFNANLNNFRRIEKYNLFATLPLDVKRYAYASLIKRKKELRQYPEYLALKDDLYYGIALEEKYLQSVGIEIKNRTDKTILCQAMDIADENRYRVTDIIDALNIYSKEKLREILVRGITSSVRVKEIRKLVSLNVQCISHEKHLDKMSMKEMLILLLNQESHAKTEFQNVMNSISMAFNRNFRLNENAKLVPCDEEIEQLRKDFHTIASVYLWGSKKIKNIKKPFNHYFTTVVTYFIEEDFSLDIIDSSTYKKALIHLESSDLNKEDLKYQKLLLLRNFLGGLTNLKIMELFRIIKVEAFEKKYHHSVDKKEKLIYQVPMRGFEKKLEKYRERIAN